MPYVTPTEVRLFTDLTVVDISDADLTTFISYATGQFNRDTQIRIVREKVDSIDNTRENKIDGSNATYYIINWEGNYIADRDNDGDVDASDVEVLSVNSDGDEATVAVTSVSSSAGSITVTTAPASGLTLYLSYHYSVVPTTHILTKLAVAYLAASLAYGKIDIGAPSSFSIGEIRMVFGSSSPSSFQKYMDLYTATVAKINDKMIEVVEGEVTV